MISLGYSDATRCPACSFKAVLSERQADTFGRASRHGLIPYECPYGSGWHVQVDLSRYPRTHRPPLPDVP